MLLFLSALLGTSQFGASLRIQQGVETSCEHAKLFVYDVNLSDFHFSDNIINSYEEVVSNVDAVFGSDSEDFDRAIYDKENGLVASASKSGCIVTKAEDADFLFLPIWPFGLCSNTRSVDSWEKRFKRLNPNHVCKEYHQILDWLFQQSSWQNRQGRDHLFFMTNLKQKDAGDILSPYTLLPKAISNSSRGNGYIRSILQGVLLTAQDRMDNADTRIAQGETVVVPYYIPKAKWFVEDAPKTLLAAYVGSVSALDCHMGKKRCQEIHWRAPLIRSKIAAELNQHAAFAERMSLSNSAEWSSMSAMSIESVEDEHALGVLDDLPLDQINETKMQYISHSMKGGMAQPQDIYAQSVFCPVPCGDSPDSKRLFSVIMAKCIPVIMSDFIQFPYPHVLDWNEFTVTIKEDHVLNDGFMKDLQLLAKDSVKMNALFSALDKARHKLFMGLGEDGALLSLQEELGKVKTLKNSGN
eukprot:gnl/MRDRNA2_/MRDRNA2_82997_c0_seq1.p1 gnl/MRDRNA2_/MRDRNA2_82997_c0~~gnl/MRDRNA2_/MRDRNA2_82997_c0_seq1.p1  ORF type:complete len:469 (+),score=57.61 gnl/MRDRNA2_/MRDRNA2_82997_c0_seq1:91-1497(+)